MTLFDVRSLAILAIFTTTIVAGDVLHLTLDNYDVMTAEKSVFIKFYAPWVSLSLFFSRRVVLQHSAHTPNLPVQQCGHCKKLAPAWEKLAADWQDSPAGLVAKVDCTVNRKLCDTHGVHGFPTIKYGSDPSSLSDYQGGRSYQDLATFCAENLKPQCSPANLESCDAETKKELQAWMKKSDEDILVVIKEEKQKLKDAQKELKKATEELEHQYNDMSAEKERKIKEVKESGLGIAKSIKAFKEKKQGHGSNGEL